MAQGEEMSNGWVRVLMEMVPPSTLTLHKIIQKAQVLLQKLYIDYGGFTRTIAFENKQLASVFRHR